MVEDEHNASPGPRPILRWPIDETKQWVPVRRAELQDFAEEVVRVVENPIEAAGAWAYAWFGVGITAVFSLVALLVAADVPAGVIAGHGAAIFVGFFLARFLWWIDKKGREGRTDDAARLASKIRDVENRVPIEGPAE